MTYEEFQQRVGDVILTDAGNCPVTPVVQMLQGKWKLQILYELCINAVWGTKKGVEAHHKHGINKCAERVGIG